MLNKVDLVIFYTRSNIKETPMASQVRLLDSSVEHATI